MASGQEIALLHGHLGPVHCLALAPDGKTIVTGSEDTSILFWDLLSPLPVGGKPVEDADWVQQSRLWSGLGDQDAAIAFRTVCVLSKSPKIAIPLLRKFLAAEPARDQRRIRRLVADLDDSEFTVRQSAQEELAKLGALAEPELKDAHKNPASPEVEKRVDGLLHELRPNPLGTDQLRKLRAIQVLESLGTEEARRLLEILSKGEPLALQTKDALAARGRLNR